MFAISIKTDNAAFGDDFSGEIKRILSKVQGQLACGETSGVLRDTNGNRVGSWVIDKDEEYIDLGV